MEQADGGRSAAAEPPPLPPPPSAAAVTAATPAEATPQHNGDEGQQPQAAPLLRVRIVALDYYMAPPLPGLDPCYSGLEGAPVDRVPVVRVFGATPAGQKACVHLHRAFPYFYVPYDDDLPSGPDEAAGYLRHLGASLEAALHLASSSAAAPPGPAPPPQGHHHHAGPPPPHQQHQQQQHGGHGGRRRQRVAAVGLVRAVPMYGYHPEERAFAKIVL
jgi:DNA polymerase zeta